MSDAGGRRGSRGLEMIPALVRARDDAESLELALIENMAREDLNPVEEARACAALVEELGLSREDVGLRVGRSRVAVSNLIRLLDLPDEALELLEAGAPQRGSRPGAADWRAIMASAAGWRGRRPSRAGRSAISRPGRERRTTRGGPQAPAPSRSRPSHPDQLDACAAIGEALGVALGADVRVAVARGGAYRVEMLFSSPEEALALAERLRIGAPAASGSFSYDGLTIEP